MSKPYIFYVDGMSCISCSNVIEKGLRSQSTLQIDYFNADLTTPDPKKVTIILANDNTNNQWDQLKNHIEQIGFECKKQEYEPHQTLSNDMPQKAIVSTWERIKKILSSHWFLGAVGSITGIALLTTFLVTGGLPLAAMIALGAVSTVLTFILGAHSYYDAWKKLTKSKTLTMDSLFAISTLTVIAVSIAAFFVPWLPMMFEASLLIYGFRHVGLAIEETLKEKICSAQFQDRAPKTVRLVLNSGQHEMPLSYIKPNDIIEVHPGELIPLDGICDTDVLLYNTIISGSTLPHRYVAGSKVLAGMRLAEDAQPLRIRITNKAQDSYLARLDTGIAQSIHEKAPLELKTQKLLAYFIPIVIGLALLSGVLVGLFFPAAIAIQCAISVLVSACPCTLGLVIPLAVKTGIHKATEHGVHFKNSKVLQEIEQIDTVIFDLNGTLTTGVPTVKKCEVLNKKISRSELLSISAALEAESSHPVGKAIKSFAQESVIKKMEVSKRSTTHHSGLSGEINGEEYSIGGWALMQEKGIAINELETNLPLEAGDSLVYIAKRNNLLGYVIVTDPLRKDALETINILKGMGKDIHICTGSDEKTAHRYAQALGIKKVYANSIATSLEAGDRSKPAYIKALQMNKKKVAMVGDAGNDVRALAASDLGIAILSHNADELTQQHAGAVIHNGTLMPIANAFAISQQTVKNINQNLSMSLAYNLATVLISGGALVAAGFTINPAIGAALMIVQACIVLLNVYHFKQKSLPHLTQQQSDSLNNVQKQEPVSGLQYEIQPSQNCTLTDQKPHYSPPLFKTAAADYMREEIKAPEVRMG